MPPDSPDHTIARELRLALDPALESVASLPPLIDPNVHTCGTVPARGAAQLAHPDPGYWIVGMKSYGRAPTFLLATGYEQVRSVTAALAGDQQAAPAISAGPLTDRFCHVTRQLLRRANHQRVPIPSVAAATKPTGDQTRRSSHDWAVARICVGLRARKKARTWCTRTILRVVTVNVARSSAGFPQRVHMFSGRVLVRWTTCQLGGSWFAGGWGWPRAM
jgi:hypothetical protein